MNINPEIIGTFAGILTTASFLPQAIKSIKAENTKSISLLMYSTFSVGVILWLFYGIAVGSNSIIIANAVTVPLALIILYKKISNIKKGRD